MNLSKYMTFLALLSLAACGTFRGRDRAPAGNYRDLAPSDLEPRSHLDDSPTAHHDDPGGTTDPDPTRHCLHLSSKHFLSTSNG